jgi:hypothetical protein
MFVFSASQQPCFFSGNVQINTWQHSMVHDVYDYVKSASSMVGGIIYTQVTLYNTTCWYHFS